MALLSGQQPNHAHPADSVVGFPALGAVEDKVDVLEEINEHLARRQVSGLVRVL